VCPSPENRVYNPGFELDPTSPIGWQIDDPTVGRLSDTTSSVKAPGNNSPKAFYVVKNVGENDLTYDIHQDNIAVPIGTAVEVSAYVSTFDTYKNSAVVIRFILYFDNVEVRRFDSLGNTSWQKMVAVVPAVTTALHSVRIHVQNVNLAPDGKFSVIFDDISVVALATTGCVPPVPSPTD
jgi:dihydroorotate dehydrogenase